MENNRMNQPAAVPYTPQFPPYVKKVYNPLEKKDTRFVLLFALCALLFTDFAFFHGMHLGFTLSYALIFGVSTVYLWNKEKKQGAFPILCGLLSLAGAVTLSLFTEVFINTVMLLLIAGLFTLYCLGISGSFSHSRSNFKMLFDLFSGALLDPLSNFSDVFGAVRASAKKDNKNFSALFGVLLALPVLLIIVPLLVSSDAAFEGLIRGAGKHIGQYLAELVVAVVITPFAFSFMYGKRHRLNVKENGGTARVKRVFPASGAVSFLSVISLVYVVYLFSQLAYFFSAFKGILPEGYTHGASVYARRGFFEMFAVVAINIALISVISALTKRRGGRLSVGVKGVSLFISLFSLLMLAIAMQKMRLNIATYGYSRNRLLVCAFMIMMLLVLALFIIHIFAPKVPYMQAIILFCSALFIVLSFADINAMTAQYNSKAYETGKLSSVNVEYLADLGDSSVPSLIRLTESKDKKTAARAEMTLVEYAANSENIRLEKNVTLTAVPADFRAYAKVREEAAKAVCAYVNGLDANKKADFINKYSFFQKHEVDFFESDGSYYAWENDSGYEYNKKSGTFEFKEHMDDSV